MSLTPLKLRRATAEDAALLWQWANDLVVRANSFCSDAIAWDTHQAWFEQKLQDPGALILILQLEEEPIGQIRFDHSSDGRLQIDLSLAEQYRGKGFGKKLLQMGLLEAKQRWPQESTVHSRVLAENTASYKLFERCGFRGELKSDTTKKAYYDFERKL
jgi:RimJ/RimL family protein N-acetyltransferase